MSGMASAVSAYAAVPVGFDRRLSHSEARALPRARRSLPRCRSKTASAAVGASNGEKKEPDEILAHFLSDTAGEHFDEIPAGSLDDALATWDHPDATDAGALARIISCASGLDEDEDARKVRGARGGARGGSSPSASARGRAAGMFNVALSALDLRGGAHDAARDLVLVRMPEAGVAPDVVSYSLAVAACVHAGGDADDLIAAARRTAGADRRLNAKKPKRAKKRKGKSPERVDADEGENVRTLWEDEHLAVVSKPAGMLTHPNEASGGATRTLVEALLDAFGDEGLSAINGADARGIVHRLDKPTSGAMLVAKTDLAHAMCVAAWYQRKVTKTYLALVEGVPGRRRGRRRGDDGDAMEGTCVAPADGRPARSDWRVVETFGEEDGDDAEQLCSLVEVTPRTGRRHQIRQHMGMALDAPLVGDPLYRRGKRPNTPAAAAPFLVGKPGSVLFLHSAALALRHPVTGEALSFSDPLPAAFEGLVSALRRR